MSEPSIPSDAIKAGLLLLVAAVAALIVANSGMAGIYKAVLGTSVGFDLGPIELSSSLKDWIKNALMAVFLLYVGVEIKAEFTEGALAEPQRAALPFAAALGGMAIPAVMFLAITTGSPELTRGWAIPTATDIAFAIGVVGLLGQKVSAPLRVFLLAVAVIDNLGAILILAALYTGALKAWALVGMVVLSWVLRLLNTGGEARLWPYLVAGAILWLFALQSGMNATLAGLITALCIPFRVGDDRPLNRLANRLRAPVNFGVMPLFAFANAGVSLVGLGLDELLWPTTMGIALGLTLGKPLGITLAVAAAVKFGWASLPENTRWSEIVGVGCLAGIGFTMSLFIGALAFADESLMNQVRLGVLGGSLVSALLGIAILSMAGRKSDRR